MRQFKLFWLDGKEETIEGFDIIDALRKAGIGPDVMKAFDHYREIKEGDDT